MGDQFATRVRILDRQVAEGGPAGLAAAQVVDTGTGKCSVGRFIRCDSATFLTHYIVLQECTLGTGLGILGVGAGCVAAVRCRRSWVARNHSVLSAAASKGPLSESLTAAAVQPHPNQLSSERTSGFTVEVAPP